jgi:hypothetical protein
MTKRGCLNCHFLCVSGIDEDSHPCEASAGGELRSRDDLDEYLKSLARSPQYPWSIECFFGNWNAARIGKKNTGEIINAIFSKKRRKCIQFVPYDKYADPNATIESEEKKAEARDRKITRIIAVVAIVISLAALMVAVLVDLDKITKHLI